MARLDKEMFRPLIDLIKIDIDNYAKIEDHVIHEDYPENYSYTDLDQFSHLYDDNEEENLA